MSFSSARSGHLGQRVSGTQPGGLIAGIFGGWRAARLRPADALSKVA